MGTIPIPEYQPQVGVPRGAPRTDVYRAPPPGVNVAGAALEALGEAGAAIKHEIDQRDDVDVLAYDQKLAALDQQAKIGDDQNPGAARLLGVNAAGSTKNLLGAWDKGAALPKLRTKEAQIRAQHIRDVRRQDLNEHLTGHEYTQGQVAFNETAKASLVTLTNEAGMATDPKSREAALARIQDVSMGMAKRNGLSPEAATLFTGQNESHALTAIVENMATADPLAAQAFVDSEPRILFDDRAALNKTLKPIVNDGAAAQQFQDLLTLGPGALAGASPDAPKAAPANVAVVQSDYRTIANDLGFTISSMQRSPEAQARLVATGAGVKNSQHVTGTACDFSVKGKTPEECEKLIAALKANGYQVVDERSHGGTGPHIHAELLPGGIPAPAAPQSKAEILDLIGHIANPQRRSAVMGYATRYFEAQTAQKQERDRALSESVYSKVNAARGTGLPLSKVLSPAEFLAIQATDKVSGLLEILSPKNSDTGSLTDKGRIDQQFYWAAGNGTPKQQAAGRAFVAAFDPFDTQKYALTNEQRGSLADQRTAFAKHDPKAIAEVKDLGELVTSVMYNTHGFLDHPKGSNADAAFNSFQAALTASIQKFKADPRNKGALPTHEQAQQMADVLVMQTSNGHYAYENFPSGGAATPSVGAVEVPADFAAGIRKEDKAATDAEIRRAYFLAKARGLL